MSWDVIWIHCCLLKFIPCLCQTLSGSLIAVSPAPDCCMCIWPQPQALRWDPLDPPRLAHSLSTVTVSPTDLCSLLALSHKDSRHCQGVGRQMGKEASKAKIKFCPKELGNPPHTTSLHVSPPSPLHPGAFQLFSPQFTDADTVNEAWTIQYLISDWQWPLTSLGPTPSGSGSPLRGGSFEREGLRTPCGGGTRHKEQKLAQSPSTDFLV